MNFLVVENDTRIVQLLNRGLTEDGHYMVHVNNGQDGLIYAQERRFDVIILNIALAVLDGFSVLRRLRQSDCTTPVLALTAKGAINDVVQSLDLGADECLAKHSCSKCCWLGFVRWADEAITRGPSTCGWKTFYSTAGGNGLLVRTGPLRLLKKSTCS